MTAETEVSRTEDRIRSCSSQNQAVPFTTLRCQELLRIHERAGDCYPSPQEELRRLEQARWLREVDEAVGKVYGLRPASLSKAEAVSK